MTECQPSIIDLLLLKNFQEEQLNSRFPVFSEQISNPSRFPVFPEVVVALNYLLKY